jgi:predicted house-cleaning noncanonical NTP pyrophosphatase (MazG superfamily)
MRITYQKLIRDKIPAIITATGKHFETAVYDEADYQQALRQKLVEEAEEVSAANEQKELIKEIADLYEVVDALLAVHEIKQEEVLAVQAQRRNKRGAFASRLELLWVEEAK